MMKSKTLLLLLASGLLGLVGCSYSKSDSQPRVYGEGGILNEIHREKEPEPTVEIIHKPESPAETSHKAVDEAVNDWEPNEGHLVRAGELVMDLKRDLGRAPTVGEMQNYLQANMGLSSSEANKVLEELGLL